jgi:acyl-CoA synthetase (NDP forming)
VVGATDTPRTQQRAQWEQVHERLTARGAQVVPVHPTKEEILGVRAYRSVLDVPFAVDLAIVLVREPIPVLQECMEKGVRAAVVFAAGFGEVGTDEGTRGQEELARLSSGSLRILGPNTNLNIFQPFRRDLPGRKLAIITQSGYQGRPIAQGEVLGIGIQSWATLGNEVDLEFADFAAYYAGLPDTGAIAGYVEGFRDGRTLMLAADAAAAQGVPIVLIKVGRSDEGRRMAQAHTGHLTGTDAVYDAVFEQCGVVRVDDIDEVIEISGMFCHAGLLRPGSAGGVAIYAMSGGTASQMVDMCASAGLSVPRLEQRTIDGLEEFIPWFLRKDNPVDTGGTITALPAGRAVLDLMMADGNTDVLLAPITGVFPGMSDALARDLIDLHRQGSKPVIAVWTSPLRDDPAYRSLCEAGVPLFHSYGAAVRGIRALVDFSTFCAERRDLYSSMPTTRSPAAAAALAVLDRRPVPSAVDALEILECYGIPTAKGRVVAGADEAAQVAHELGLPLVAKLESPQVSHKSDLGLVVPRLDSASAAAAAVELLLGRAADEMPEAAVDGVLLQPMVTDVVAEAIIGFSQQPAFGPTIVFGLGGIFTEVLGDVVFGVPPFDRARARRMVQGIRGAAVLAGARGRPAGDTGAVVDALMALQRLALDLGDRVAEMDVNPLMVLPEGSGVVAVDALIVPRSGSGW